MKNIIRLASLAVVTANVLGMNVENRLSTNPVNMRSISSSDECEEQIRQWTKKIINKQRNEEKFNVLDEQGNTILIDAVRNAPIPVIKQLLNIKDDKGKPLVDVNAKDKDGNTALLIAVKSKDNEKIELLIKYDALSKNDLNSFDKIVSNRYKMTLSSVEKQIDEIGRKINKELQELTQAMISCGESEESRSKLKEALNNWKEVNAPVMGEGLTPLMYAAMNDKRSATEVLLTFEDINVNLRWKGDNGTALAFAVSKGYSEIVNSLLDHKDIQVNLADKEGNTPLSYAIFKNRGSIVEILINRGADVKTG